MTRVGNDHHGGFHVRFQTYTRLAAGVLSVFAATPAMAGEGRVPFSATGEFISIDTGDVDAAGASGRFVVKERTALGMFYDDIGGTTGEPFALIYGSNVPIATQSGQVHARLFAGTYEAAAVLTSSIGLTPLECSVPDGSTCIATPDGNFMPGLLLDGTATFIDGAHGHGTLKGWLIPILDAEGHILSIYASSLSFAGEWRSAR